MNCCGCATAAVQVRERDDVVDSLRALQLGVLALSGEREHSVVRGITRSEGAQCVCTRPYSIRCTTQVAR